MVLRGTNFSCSLIVLSMIATTFTIFNTTKSLPPRNNLPAWAQGISTWPQITLLCVACISLFMSVLVFHGYWRGGHRRAEKVAVYYSIFAVAFFTFSIVMWATAAAVLHQSKANGNGHDMWGWSCNDNTRRTLFQEEVHYTLICRLQVNNTTMPFFLFCAPRSMDCYANRSPVELVPRLRYHRNRHRNNHNRNLRHSLLPLLLPTPSPQEHGNARPCQVRPLPGPVALPIRAQHTRLRPHVGTRGRLQPNVLPAMGTKPERSRCGRVFRRGTRRQQEREIPRGARASCAQETIHAASTANTDHA